MQPKYFYIFLLLAISPGLGRGKDLKTGTVEKNLFTDSKYNYQFTVPENWKAKTEKEPSPLRAVLQKTKVERYGSVYYSQTQVSIPSVFICVETTSLGLEEFCEVLLENPQKLPHSETYLYRLEFLTSSEPLERIKIAVDSVEAKKIYMRKRYFKPVQDPREGYGQPDKTTLVEDFLLGFFLVFKKDHTLFLIQGSCDRETFRMNEPDWQKLLDSWKFIQPTRQTPQN